MPDSRDSEVYKSRLARCQEVMREREVDTLFLVPGPNMYYLSGFLEEPGERLLALILPQSGEPVFLVPELYEAQVRSVSWVENLIILKDSEDPKTALSTVAKAHMRNKTVGVDSRMWSRFLIMLLEIAQDARYVDAASVMNELRIRKTKWEIELLERSADIADAALVEVLNYCKQGMRENEVAARIVYELRRRGADGIAFEPVASSGPNAALPHYRSGDRKLLNGDLVVLDFGCLYRGYNSDITRTVAIGSCSLERKKVHSVVRSAQEAACQKAVEGIEAQSVDGVARGIIEAAGYGRFFIHRTGHGIGLEIHEEPYIVAGNSTRLTEGMAFSVEPGIYIPGEYGVRIEDIVVMESGKARRLNKAPRELMIL